MHSMLQFPNYQDQWDQRRQHNGHASAGSTATASNPAGVGGARYQYNTGARNGGGGYTVIDDDDWQTRGTFRSLSSGQFSDNFPTLPQNAGANAASASASNAKKKALWGNAKALGAVKNAPKSSKLKKAEMTDSWDAPVTKVPKPTQTQSWRGKSATRKRFAMAVRLPDRPVTTSRMLLLRTLGWCCNLVPNPHLRSLR